MTSTISKDSKAKCKTAVHQTMQAHRKWIEQMLRGMVPTDADKNLRQVRINRLRELHVLDTGSDGPLGISAVVRVFEDVGKKKSVWTPQWYTVHGFPGYPRVRHCHHRKKVI